MKGLLLMKVIAMVAFTFLGMVWMLAYVLHDHVRKETVKFEDVAGQKTWSFLMSAIFHGIALFIAMSI